MSDTKEPFYVSEEEYERILKDFEKAEARLAEADPEKEYTVHRLANEFPEMDSEDFERLRQSIAEHGLLNPITVLEKEKRKYIIDGKERLRACELEGVTPRFEEWNEKVPGGESPKNFVYISNVVRRHLNKEQLAALAVLFDMPRLEEAARRRQAHGQTAPGKTLLEKSPAASEKSKKGKATQIAAQKWTTNEKYVWELNKVYKTNPDLVKRVARGEISRPEAVRIAEGRDDVVIKKQKPKKGATPEPEDDRELRLGIQKAVTLSHFWETVWMFLQGRRPHDDARVEWFKGRPILVLPLSNPKYPFKFGRKKARTAFANREEINRFIADYGDFGFKNPEYQKESTDWEDGKEKYEAMTSIKGQLTEAAEAFYYTALGGGRREERLAKQILREVERTAGFVDGEVEE